MMSTNMCTMNSEMQYILHGTKYAVLYYVHVNAQCGWTSPSTPHRYFQTQQDRRVVWKWGKVPNRLRQRMTFILASSDMRRFYLTQQLSISLQCWFSAACQSVVECSNMATGKFEIAKMQWTHNLRLSPWCNLPRTRMAAAAAGTSTGAPTPPSCQTMIRQAPQSRMATSQSQNQKWTLSVFRNVRRTLMIFYIILDFLFEFERRLLYIAILNFIELKLNDWRFHELTFQIRRIRISIHRRVIVTGFAKAVPSSE